MLSEALLLKYLCVQHSIVISSYNITDIPLVNILSNNMQLSYCKGHLDYHFNSS